MPNRILKESITTSDTLAQVSADAERCFWRLVVLADDYGRFDARPLIILGKGFAAMLERVKAKDVERWLVELEGVNLIRRYAVDGHAYLWITTWDTHQQTRAARSKYPQPPAVDSPSEGLLTSDSNGNQSLANVPVLVLDNVSDNDNDIRAAKAADPRIPEVFRYYQEKIQPAARLIDAARDKIRTRLKTFPQEDLLLAVDHMAADAWWMEANGRRGAAWFFESDARIEMLVNLVPNARPSANGRQQSDPVRKSAPRPSLPAAMRGGAS